jgi:hypothetical protein
MNTECSVLHACCVPGECLWCRLDRKLGRPDSRCGRSEKEKQNPAATGNRKLVLQRPFIPPKPPGSAGTTGSLLPHLQTVTYRKVWHKPHFARSQKWVFYTLGQLCVCVCVCEGSPLQIQTTTRWNPIGCSMTAPPPLYSPSSILPPPSYHCALIRAGNNLARVLKSVNFDRSTGLNLGQSVTA